MNAHLLTGSVSLFALISKKFKGNIIDGNKQISFDLKKSWFVNFSFFLGVKIFSIPRSELCLFNSPKFTSG